MTTHTHAFDYLTQCASYLRSTARAWASLTAPERGSLASEWAWYVDFGTPPREAADTVLAHIARKG